MAAEVEKKKQEKFNAMIERGASIAAQQKGLVVDKMVDDSITSDKAEDSDQNKVTRAALAETTKMDPA